MLLEVEDFTLFFLKRVERLIGRTISLARCKKVTYFNQHLGKIGYRYETKVNAKIHTYYSSSDFMKGPQSLVFPISGRSILPETETARD